MKYSLIALALVASTVHADEGVSQPGTGIFHEAYTKKDTLLICSISEEGVKFIERAGTNEKGDWKDRVDVSYTLPESEWTKISSLLVKASEGTIRQSAYPCDVDTVSTKGSINGKTFYIGARLECNGRYSNSKMAAAQLKAKAESLCSVTNSVLKNVQR